MSDPMNMIKESVRALRAYSLKADRTRIKLNQNENPWDLPLAIKQETLRRLAERPWSRYPDFSPQSLRESLAKFSGWMPGGILVGNGSNELIQALLMVTVEAGVSSSVRPSGAAALSVSMAIRPAAPGRLSTMALRA